MANDLPPTSELFEVAAFSARHGQLTPLNRVIWAVRRRHKNGLAAVGGTFESPLGIVLIHEPTFIRWLLGLAGKSAPRKPRAARQTAAA